MSSNVSRAPSKGATVLIAGAGVGGLMAALECWRHGFEVRILERTPENVSTGDSFGIGPSASTTFKHYPDMEAKKLEIQYDPFFTMHNSKGERLSEPIQAGTAFTNDPGLGTMWRFSRPEFHAMLLEQAEKCGLVVEYGKPVVDYFENEEIGKGGVVLKNGDKIEADLVVAADGVRGASWQLVAGHPVPARSSGMAVFRVAMPINKVMADPIVADRFKLYPDGSPSAEMWTAPGNLTILFGVTKDCFEWSITHPDTGTGSESWTNNVSVDSVLQVVSAIPDWPEAATRAIKLSPEDRLIDWKLMWRDPQPKWTSPAGRVVQLGDAAHTFLPSSGNGATQAIEDSISLAACLAVAGGSADKIPEAVRVHNLLRYERVSFLQAFGVANMEARHKATNARVLAKTLGAWLLKHDAAQYAVDRYAEARAHVVEGKPFKSTNTPRVEYRPWTIESLTDAIRNDKPCIMDGDWS